MVPSQTNLMNEMLRKKLWMDQAVHYYEYVSDRAGRSSHRKPGFCPRLRSHWFLLALLPLRGPCLCPRGNWCAKSRRNGIGFCWRIFTVLFDFFLYDRTLQVCTRHLLGHLRIWAFRSNRDWVELLYTKVEGPLFKLSSIHRKVWVNFCKVLSTAIIIKKIVIIMSMQKLLII